MPDFMIFKNASGQEPSAPENPNSPDPYAGLRHRMFNRYVEQAGFLPLDLARCQAPSVVDLRKPRWRGRCENAPTCVAVENAPRENGKIAAMALCDHCRDIMILGKGKDWAEITSLDVLAPIAPPPAPPVAPRLSSPRAVAPSVPGKK